MTSYPKFPKKLLLSSGFDSVSAPAAAIYNNFFSELSDILGAIVQNVSIAGLWNETSSQTLPVTTLMNQVGPSFSGDAFRALLTCDSRPTRLSLRSTNGMPSVNPSSMHTPPPSGDESRISTLPYFFAGNMGLRKARLGMTLSLRTERLLKTGHCPICLDRATTRARMRSISIRECYMYFRSRRSGS